MVSAAAEDAERDSRLLDGFIADVDDVVASYDDEREITARVADLMSGLLASDYRIPAPFTRPAPDHHVNYPLHRSPDGWCLASVVWHMGQRTPVHGHETWGVVGVYAGTEREIRYVKPDEAAPPGPLAFAGEQVFGRGQVTVCCTTDDDVHAVTAIGDEPTIGLHVYGADIGTIRRRRYDPATGEVTWFVGGWDDPGAAEPGPSGAATGKEPQ